MIDEGHVRIERFDPPIHLQVRNLRFKTRDFEHVLDGFDINLMCRVICGWNQVVDIPSGFSEIRADFRNVLQRQKDTPFAADACGSEIPDQKHGVDSDGSEKDYVWWHVTHSGVITDID